MKHLRKLKKESGVVAIFVGLALVALVGILAYVADTGSIYQSRRSMQSAADAAALAGVQELPDNPSSAIAVATAYAEQNTTIGSSTVSVSIERTFVANDTIVVTVSDSDKSTFFAGIFGINSTSVGATAKALVGSPAEYFTDVVPWFVLQNQWVPGIEYPLDENKFGAVSFKDQGTGASVYKDNIFPGYNGILKIGDTINRLHGFKCGGTKELEDRIGAGDSLDTFSDLTEPLSAGGYRLAKPDSQMVIVPIVSQATADNYYGPIIGFAPFVITFWDKKTVLGTFLDQALIITEGEVEGYSTTGFKITRLVN